MTPALNGATLHCWMYIDSVFLLPKVLRVPLKIAIFEERIRKNPDSFSCRSHDARWGCHLADHHTGGRRCV